MDLSSVQSDPNRIVSGRARPFSRKSDFLDTLPGQLAVRIAASAIPLNLSIDGLSTTYNQDVVVNALEGVTSNNTCLANDTGMTDDLFAGEVDYVYSTGKYGVITVDAMESEMTSRIGQYQGLKIGDSYAYGLIKSANELANVRRNFFFDPSREPILTEGLSNNDTITMLTTGWLFVDSETSTMPELTYRYPVESFAAPANPVAGNYWKDLSINKWKRYSGTSWVIVKRIPVAVCVFESGECKAYRCLDFGTTSSGLNDLELEVAGDEKLALRRPGRIDIAGVLHFVRELEWNITTDLLNTAEGNSQYYNAVLTELLRPRLTENKRRPVHRPDLGGYYDPFENWKAVARAYNNADGDIKPEDGHNAYISHKNNPSLEIDQEFNFNIMARSTTVINPPPVRPYSSITRPSNGWIYINFKDGFFRNKPAGNTILGDTGNVTHSIGNPSQRPYSETGISFTYSSGNTNEAIIMLSRTGIDLLQTKLDNELK